MYHGSINIDGTEYPVVEVAGRSAEEGVGEQKPSHLLRSHLR